MTLFQSTVVEEITLGVLSCPGAQDKHSKPEKYGQKEVEELPFTCIYTFAPVNGNPSQRPHGKIACIDKTTYRQT